MILLIEKANAQDLVHVCFVMGKLSIEDFNTYTLSPEYEHEIMGASSFLKITDGMMPLIMLVDDGIIKYNYAYRSINDQEILNFLTN